MHKQVEKSSLYIHDKIVKFQNTQRACLLQSPVSSCSAVDAETWWKVSMLKMKEHPPPSA